MMMQPDSKFPMAAKTFRGLEDVLRDELVSLGAENVEIGNRMVSFEGNLEMLYKANLCCRTAVCVLVPIEKFTAHDPDELYDAVRDIDWDRYMTPDTTFAISSTVNSEEFPHSKYVTYRVKDGIADYFNDKYGRRPSIRLDGADMEFNVHISDYRVTLSLNSSGESLCKRGYRVAATEAPINEVLAAGIIMKTGWRGDTPFIDPMCGSGTFLIEAALIASNINPGIFRTQYAFERWKNFDKDLFEEIYNDDSAEREAPYKIYGGDIDPEAVAVARKNIRSARLEDCIELECKSFGEWHEAPGEIPGIMVTNPPYGERLKPDDMEGLYHEIGSGLKRVFPGWHAWIIGYDDKYFSNIGLKPSVKFPILNGSLECSLREYVMFDGAYSDFRINGGSVKNDTFERTVKPKVKRMSDKDWESETKKFTKRGDRDRKSYGDRDRDRKSYSDRDHDRKSYGDRDRDRKSYGDRDHDRKPYGDRDRDRRPFGDRKKKDGLKKVAGKMPSIGIDNTTVFTKAAMRSRRTWKKKEENIEN